ncbi:MAG TPA: DUF1622 domain-containing protein [Chloroflexi bacterium]|nr:DUF1622 domain-containing protein [Chloroflexota bacterium]
MLLSILPFSQPDPLWPLGETILSYTAQGVEIVGVLVIIVGILTSLVRFIHGTKSIAFGKNTKDYAQLRKELGQSILIGLELLVAGDIIFTAAVQPSLENLLTLGVLIVLRFMLSVALELETTGRWPWQCSDLLDDDN